VVALPGELAEDGTPGASSYQGTQNHRDLLPDALQQAHLSPATIGVINDAELAAVSASLLPEAAEKTLVLTLGFGLGAALLMAPGESVVHEIQHAPTIPIDRLEHSLGANDKRPTVLVTSGAFNPVHNNHLLYLEAARAFLARANPPTGAVRGPESAHALPMNVVGGYLSALPDKAVAKKRGGSIARVHRTEMLRRATADSSWLMVVGDELNGVELFESVERAVEKALGQPVNVVAVCGADGYRASEQFLPTRFPLACVRRTGEEDEWQRLWAEAAPARQLFLIEDNLQPQVRSATHVRELLLRAADDTSSGATAELREHLHADVLAYLLEQRLGAMERRPKKGAAKVVMSEEHIERDTSDTSTSGTSSERRIALTFDDGPGPSTSSLLDVLAKHRVKATFFLVGKNIRGFALGDERKARELVVREAREGHLLGNHADTHSRDPMPLHAFAEEIRLVDGLLRDIYAEAGVAPPTRLPFRLPYGPLVRDGGRQDERLEALTAAAKRHQHWTLITGDWKPETRADRLATSLLKHVEEMWSSNLVPVIVLHDSGAWPHANGFDRSATVQAVDELLRTLSSREARFITAEELSG
jgi:chitin deacetylase